jgi:hypothetical protein
MHKDDNTVKYNGYALTAMNKHISVRFKHNLESKYRFGDQSESLVFTLCHHKHKTPDRACSCHDNDHTQKYVSFIDYGYAKVVKIL